MAIMKTSIPLTLVMLAACLCGCSDTNLEIRTGHDKSADFSSLKTYAWMESSDTSTGDWQDDFPRIQPTILEAVDQELAAKGYERSTAAVADFVIGYHVAVVKKTEVSTIDSRSGYSPAGSWDYRHGREAAANVPSGTYVREFERGTLALSIADPVARHVIWRGWAQADIHRTTSPEHRERRVRKAVHEMLSQFPPG